VIAAWKLAAAYGLDWALGDPEWFPHPVRFIGSAIHAGTRSAQPTGAKPTIEFAQGTGLSLGVIGLSAILASESCKLGACIEVLLAWSTLATRSLLREAGSVLDALEAGDLPTARVRLSRIVGRDTGNLDGPEIVRAVIETAAESTCDGILAPLLFLAFGGVPSAFVCKAANTLDSMIGHREAPYTYFGKFAARFDDLCNFIPARLTVVALALAAGLTGNRGGKALLTAARDGRLHASPNAGPVEAAMAGALDVKLGGSNSYDGEVCQGEVLNSEGAQPTPQHGRAALRIVAVTSVLAFGVLFGAALWSGRMREAES
jgi:adenosylcobinamide-phosphate synthase